MTLLEGSSAPQSPAHENLAPSAPTKPSADQSAKPAMATPAPSMPSLTAPTPIGGQSYNPPAPDGNDVASVPIPQMPATSPSTSGDVTGSIPTTSARLGTVQIPSTRNAA